MRRRTKVVLLGTLAAVICGGLGVLITTRIRAGARTTYRFGADKKNRRATVVTVRTVEALDLQYRIAEVATVQPGRMHPVCAEVASRVTKVHFELGHRVTRGQLLVELDPEQVEIALAEARQKAARAALDLSQAEQDLVRVGALAKLLVQERRDQLAQLAVDRVKAGQDLARLEELHGRKIASATELADARSKVKNLEAGHALARTRVGLEQTRQAQAVENARHKIAGMKVAQQLAVTNVARIALDQRRHQICAQMAGVVVTKEVAVGQRTSIGVVLGQIAVVDRVLLEVGLTEAQLARVREGAAGADFELWCRVPEIGWDKPSRLTLYERRLVPMAGRTRTYPAWFLVSHADGRLVPGMTVRLEIATGVRRKVLAIPRRAVRELHGKPYVFVAHQGKAQLRAVVVRGYHGTRAVIESGLRVGDRLIVLAPAELGDRWSIRERSAGSGEGPAAGPSGGRGAGDGE